VNLSAAEGTEKVSLICRQNLPSYNYSIGGPLCFIKSVADGAANCERKIVGASDTAGRSGAIALQKFCEIVFCSTETVGLYSLALWAGS